VRIDYTVGRHCSATCSLSVASSEPVSKFVGKGDKAPDWKIIDDHNVQLRDRAPRWRSGPHYNGDDHLHGSGGRPQRTPVTVFVPHDQGW